MTDSALPFLLPVIDDSRLETIKFGNFLLALRSRRQRQARVAHRPIDVTIDMSTSCQLRCPYCTVGLQKLDRGAAVMKAQAFESIQDDIGDEAFVTWLFSTGEPLINKGLESLVARMRHRRTFSVISTNLSLPLSDERIDALLTCGLGVICVSLDGATAETYPQYRQGGDFDLVSGNMRRLIRRKRELGLTRPLIEWRFLRFRHNQHEEKLARQLAREWGVDLLEFHTGGAPENGEAGKVVSANRPLSGDWVSGPAVDAAVVRRDTPLARVLAGQHPAFGPGELRNPLPRCDWHYLGGMIHVDQGVGPCCVLNDRVHDFASLTSQDGFVQAWNTQAFQAARDAMAGKGPSNTICDRCPLPGAQTYQFLQKIRAVLRIAPTWVLKALSESPGDFFVAADRELMPQEIGIITSGRLRRHMPELLAADPGAAQALTDWRPDDAEVAWLSSLLKLSS